MKFLIGQGLLGVRVSRVFTRTQKEGDEGYSLLLKLTDAVSSSPPPLIPLPMRRERGRVRGQLSNDLMRSG